MDYIDDAKMWTAKLPDPVKQLLVMVLAAVVPLLNARFGTTLPADLSIIGAPSVQIIIATVIAFILKGHAQAKAVSLGRKG